MKILLQGGPRDGEVVEVPPRLYRVQLLIPDTRDQRMRRLIADPVPFPETKIRTATYGLGCAIVDGRWERVGTYQS